MKNIRKGPFTTILGIVIILASLASVFFGDSSWTEAVIGITCGAGFLFAPDPKKPGGTGGTAAVVIFIVVIVFLASCKTIAPQVNTAEKESYKESYTPAKVTVEGAKISTGIDSAQLAAIIAQLKAGKDTVIYRDRDGNVSMKYYLNASGKPQVECESKDRHIEYLEKEVERERSSVKTEIKTETYTPVWMWVLFGFQLALNAVLILFKRIKNLI